MHRRRRGATPASTSRVATVPTARRTSTSVLAVRARTAARAPTASTATPVGVQRPTKGAQCSSCVAGREDCNTNSGGRLRGAPRKRREQLQWMRYRVCEWRALLARQLPGSALRAGPGAGAASPRNHTPLAPAVADIDRGLKLDILVANAEDPARRRHPPARSRSSRAKGAAPSPRRSITRGPALQPRRRRGRRERRRLARSITVDGQTNLATTNGTISISSQSRGGCARDVRRGDELHDRCSRIRSTYAPPTSTATATSTSATSERDLQSGERAPQSRRWRPSTPPSS